MSYRHCSKHMLPQGPFSCRLNRFSTNHKKTRFHEFHEQWLSITLCDFLMQWCCVRKMFWKGRGNPENLSLFGNSTHSLGVDICRVVVSNALSRGARPGPGYSNTNWLTFDTATHFNILMFTYPSFYIFPFPFVSSSIAQGYLLRSIDPRVVPFLPLTLRAQVADIISVVWSAIDSVNLTWNDHVIGPLLHRVNAVDALRYSPALCVVM